MGGVYLTCFGHWADGAGCCIASRLVPWLSSPELCFSQPRAQSSAKTLASPHPSKLNQKPQTQGFWGLFLFPFDSINTVPVMELYIGFAIATHSNRSVYNTLSPGLERNKQRLQ